MDVYWTELPGGSCLECLTNISTVIHVLVLNLFR